MHPDLLDARTRRSWQVLALAPVTRRLAATVEDAKALRLAHPELAEALVPHLWTRARVSLADAQRSDTAELARVSDLARRVNAATLLVAADAAAPTWSEVVAPRSIGLCLLDDAGVHMDRLDLSRLVRLQCINNNVSAEHLALLGRLAQRVSSLKLRFGFAEDSVALLRQLRTCQLTELTVVVLAYRAHAALVELRHEIDRQVLTLKRLNLIGLTSETRAAMPTDLRAVRSVHLLKPPAAPPSTSFIAGVRFSGGTRLKLTKFGERVKFFGATPARRGFSACISSLHLLCAESSQEELSAPVRASSASSASSRCTASTVSSVDSSEHARTPHGTTENSNTLLTSKSGTPTELADGCPAEINAATRRYALVRFAELLPPLPEFDLLRFQLAVKGAASDASDASCAASRAALVQRLAAIAIELALEGQPGFVYEVSEACGHIDASNPFSIAGDALVRIRPSDQLR